MKSRSWQKILVRKLPVGWVGLVRVVVKFDYYLIGYVFMKAKLDPRVMASKRA